MGSVEYVVELEQQMELVPLKRGWWVAFGGPRQQPATVSVSVVTPAGDERPVPREPDQAPEQPKLPRGRGRSRAAQRAGTVPPAEPRRRRREPQPPSPRPMPDPAPSPVPEPPSTPDMPVMPHDSRGGRR